MKKILMSIFSIALVLCLGFAAGCSTEQATLASFVRVNRLGTKLSGEYAYEYELKDSDGDKRSFTVSVTAEGEETDYKIQVTGQTDVVGKEAEFELGVGDYTITVTYLGDNTEKFGGNTTATIKIKITSKTAV